MRFPQPPPRDPVTDDGSFFFGFLVAISFTLIVAAVVGAIVVLL